MWISLAAAASALPQLGYPIFVHSQRGRCTFQIQDMIMSRGRDVRRWLRDLGFKHRQIDIVWSEEADKARIPEARAFARTGGFSNIAVRNGSGLDYPSRLPPH